jgi:hypothetical protein
MEPVAFVIVSQNRVGFLFLKKASPRGAWERPWN